MEEKSRGRSVAQTFYRWKKVYAGMGVSEIWRLKDLEKNRAILVPLMEWMAPALGMAMCHIGCCQLHP